VARTVTRQNRNVQFVIVGEGAYREEYMKRAVDMGISDRVTWTGMVEDPFGEAVFEAADVVCQFSRWEEVFGWMIAEGMAQVPEGATLLRNPISHAPGFQIGNVYVLPGVPQIMQAIFSELRPRLKGGAKWLSRSVSCALGEGALAKDLGELQARYPDLEIGSYPYFRRSDFGVTLVLRGTDRARLIEATEALSEIIRALGGDPREGLAEG